MTVLLLLAASLAGASPAPAPAAATHCNPDPSKSLACKRPANPVQKTASRTLGRCHPHHTLTTTCGALKAAGSPVREAASGSGDERAKR